MKRFFLLMSMIVVMILGFNCCETEEPCEQNNYGTVIVKNQTGYDILVDVMDDGWISERYLSNGSQTTYDRVSAGDISIWGYNGQNEAIEDHYLSSCEEFTFTWYTSKKKSGDGNNLYLKISVNGHVIKTVSVDDLEIVQEKPKG